MAATVSHIKPTERLQTNSGLVLLDIQIQPMQLPNGSRIIYPKQFLVDCFRNPACRKKPENLPDHLGITLDTPRIQGLDPCPPFVPLNSYRQPYHGGQSRFNNRPRNTVIGTHHRPEPPVTQAREEPPAVEKIRKDEPQPPPVSMTKAPEFDIRRFWANLVFNGTNPEIPEGNPSAANSIKNKQENCLGMNQSVPVEEAPHSEQDLARHLGDSLRSMLSIGNVTTQNLQSATSRKKQTDPVTLLPVDERQQHFQKIMEELVMNGTKKVFEGKQTLGMIFGL